MAQSELELVLKAAGELVRQERLQEAVTSLVTLEGANPENLEVCALLGLVLFRLGRYPEALPRYERLVRANLADGVSRLNLGIVLLKLDRAEASISHLEAARTLDPGQQKTVSYLGLAYASAGRLADAYRAFCQVGQADLAREVAQSVSPAELAAIDRELATPPPRQASRPISHPPPMRPTTAPPPPLRELALPPPTPGPSLTAPPPAAAQVSSDAPRARRESHVERMVREIAPAKTASTDATEAMLLSRFAASRLESTPSKGFTATRDGVISAAVNGAICARLKHVVAYSGELTSQVLMRRSRGHELAEAFAMGDDPVYRISGQGICTWQAPAGKLLELDEDILYLPEELVLAFSEELRWENGYVPGTNRARSFVQFRGTGTVAVVWPTLPRGLKVAQRHPQYVVGEALLGWVGRIVPRATHASNLLTEKPAVGAWLECSGEGVVFVEQQAS
ncbi:MAG: tetratricopeptide repeat protein [Myxococcales bacterium]|nr:tetratricopeptide repeat protein [Myxococcales bacterium]